MERNPTQLKHLHYDIINNILQVLPSKSLVRFTSACKTWYYLIKSLQFILQVLPSKSLVRFASVCKRWYNLIKSPQFIGTHVNVYRSDAQNHEILVLGQHICYILANKTLIQCINLDFKVDFILTPTSIGSCNGLVLIPSEVGDTNEYLLWNPTIQKSKKFDPKLYECNQGVDWVNHEIFGLGFHESYKDHRVIRIVYVIDNRVGGVGDIPPEVDVYSLTTDSWHKIDSSLNRLVVCSPGAFVNGAIHWLATTRFTKLSSSPREDLLESILLFNFRNECFKEMALPEHLHCPTIYMSGLNEFKGSLAVNISHDHMEESFVVDLWVMTNYGVVESWTKKFTIKSEETIMFRLPMGLLKSGIWVYMERPENEKPIMVFNDVDRGQKWHIDWLMDAGNVMDLKDSLFLF